MPRLKLRQPSTIPMTISISSPDSHRTKAAIRFLSWNREASGFERERETQSGDIRDSRVSLCINLSFLAQLPLILPGQSA